METARPRVWVCGCVGVGGRGGVRGWGTATTPPPGQRSTPPPNQWAVNLGGCFRLPAEVALEVAAIYLFGFH